MLQLKLRVPPWSHKFLHPQTHTEKWLKPPKMRRRRREGAARQALCRWGKEQQVV